MKSGLKALTAILAAMFCIAPVQAQHTLGIVGGGGMTTARLYPSQETRGIWGVMSGGISWRYYSAPRFVGCIGLDLEFMQRGFSYAPDASRHDEDKQYHYYTRMYDALSLPVVWQPHVYLFKNHLRIYLEAALNLELNLSSRFEYKLHTGEVESGVYQIKNYRDNRFGYGLCGGGGIDAIFGRFELGVRVRYYFGLSDIMKNRNKYYDNGTDNSYVNPFTLTPLRSPVDNLMFSVKLGFRFNRNGFDEWYMKRPKRDRKAQTFNFSLD